MGKDKKVRDGRITLILPRRIGEAFVMKDAPLDELRGFSRRSGVSGFGDYPRPGRGSVSDSAWMRVASSSASV